MVRPYQEGQREAGMPYWRAPQSDHIRKALLRLSKRTHPCDRQRSLLALRLEILKVSTLQNWCLSSVAKRFKCILQATDGGGSEHI
jgi:hypothetical protein